MAIKGRKTTNKNPPVLSQEFFIQNHADIFSCVTLVIVVGVMVQATAPVASMFLSVQHNLTVTNAAGESAYLFTNGWKDICTTIFYFLITIVVHAILLEYVLDKISRKLHLSKVRHSQFNESGQLLVFYLFSILWGADIILRENYAMNIATLWEGYPHIAMTSYAKFFYIVQLAYWLHAYPELYFQKAKKEDILPRVVQASACLVFIGLAYITNFNRVALCLTVLHYVSETTQHLAIMLEVFRKDESVSRIIPNVVFVLVRLTSIILSVLTFWYGLSLSENQGLDFATGNFNTQLIRIFGLVSVGMLQAYLMWNFITSQLAGMREASAVTQAPRKKAPVKTKKDKKREADEVSDLPEVDQNTAKKNSLRARTQRVK